MAGAGSSPDGTVVGPPGLSQGVAPDADAGEEVTLVESVKIVGLNIHNAPFVHDAVSDVPGLDEFPQPLGRELVVLVVVCAHVLSLIAGMAISRAGPLGAGPGHGHAAIASGASWMACSTHASSAVS